MPSTTPDWDAKTYERLASPQEEWARKLIDERLPLEGDEKLLDAGCGSGRVTRLLLERLTTGRVLGVDGSPAMAAHARESLTEFGDRLVVLNCDLLDLDPKMVQEALDAPVVDLIFSNATFHWIEDHDRLFSRLFAVLAPGGALEAQCGGTGNVAEWVEAIERASARPEFEEALCGFSPWHFPGIDETALRLRDAGFEGVECWIDEVEKRPDDPRNWVSVVGLAPQYDRLPANLRDPFTDAVMEQLPDQPVFHYVRLNISAVKPGG